MVNNTNAQASASTPYCTPLCVKIFTIVLLLEQRKAKHLESCAALFFETKVFIFSYNLSLAWHSS
jgi:hypothetical protein